MKIKVLGIKMPKKKRKSSLGRSTANAKNMKKTRFDEDDQTSNYRGSPVSAIFGFPANRTIGKTALIGD